MRPQCQRVRSSNREMPSGDEHVNRRERRRGPDVCELLTNRSCESSAGQDVDDGLGENARDRRAPDVMDRRDRAAKHARHLGSLALEL